MGALEPLRIDDGFWQREGVRDCVRRRDIRTLFTLLRKYEGASQHRIGTAVDIQQGTVSAIMKGDRAVSSIDVLERIAAGLNMPDETRMLMGLAPKENAMRRRTALGIGLVAAISPATLTEVLRESAAEALEFTREQAVTAVGSGTLDHLEFVVGELDRSYQTTSPAELFPIARAYRQRVAQLIGGRHTLREARELYVYAARLSYLLSDLGHDLNSWLTAEAYAIDSQQHAREAGHAELCAWAADALTSAPYWTGHYADSIKAALQGLQWVDNRHHLAVRLRSKAARAYASLGDSAACTELLAQACMLCDRLSEQVGEVTVAATREYTFYTLVGLTASCQLTLGDWAEAARNAQQALGVATISPGRADIARLDLGIALVNAGSPDEGVAHGLKALDSQRWLGGLLPRAQALDETLMARYSGQASSQEFHERYRQLRQSAITN